MHAVRRRAHRIANRTDDGVFNFGRFERVIPSQDADLETGAPTETQAAHDSQSVHSHESPGERPTGESQPVIDDSDAERINHIETASTTGTSADVTKRAKFQGIFRKDHHGELYEDTLEERRRKALKQKIPVLNQLKDVLCSSWAAMILLLCIPAGFAVNYTHLNAVVVFCINLAAIVPSATFLGIALDELSKRTGENVSALLNQTFGNAVQLILSVFLLKSRQIAILKLTLLGVILSNLLVTTGLSFLLGGMNRMEQFFNASLAQMISMLLLLAVTSLIIPTAAHLMTNTNPAGITGQSRGISVVILISYIFWLRFSIFTHRVMFSAPNQKVPKRKSQKVQKGEAVAGIAAIGAGTAAASGGVVNAETLFKNPYPNDDEEDDDFEAPKLSLMGAIITLIVSITLLAFNTQFATDSIQAILQRRKVSQTFLSLIILPLLGIDPMAVKMAIIDKMNISISLALERCMQTSLLLVPLTVLLAWCMGVDDMNLQFDGFSIATMFASIIIVTYVVQEGRSNWLTGVLLLKVFIIIAISSFYIH